MQSACRKIKWVIYAYETQKNARGTAMYLFQTVDKALLLQGFAIVGTAFLI